MCNKFANTNVAFDFDNLSPINRSIHLSSQPKNVKEFQILREKSEVLGKTSKEKYRD